MDHEGAHGIAAWAITRTIAASRWLTGGWTGVITFVPELFLIGGKKLLFAR
jgi:hypothetical protein